MRNTEFIRNHLLLLLGFSLMLAALGLVFLYAPDIYTDGELRVDLKILFFHVPIAWISLLAFFVVFIASILYLWKREEKWDIMARSSGEIGFIFITLVLITGPIWAKPAWNTWWIWDVRLTSSLVLWFIYLGYLMVRSLTIEENRGARFAAVFGIFGFIDVPIVYLAVKWGFTLHPGSELIQGGLEGSWILTLVVSVAAFTVLYAYLLLHTVSIKRMEADIEDLERHLER